MSAPFKPPEIARKSPTNLQNIPVDAAYRFSPLSEHFPVQHMPENDGKDVSSLSVSSLKAELEKRGLSSEGVKVVLIVRLTKAIRQEKYSSEVLKEPNLTAENRFDDKMSATDTPAAGAIPENEENVKNVEMKEEEEADITIEESNELHIVEDSEVVTEMKMEVKMLAEQEMEQKVEKKEAEPIAEQQQEVIKEEEEVEGEDEFEEDDDDDDVMILEPPKKEEKSEKEESPEPPFTTQQMQNSQEDEIFLDYEEDLLEDPLDENPVKEEKKASEPTSSATSSEASGAPKVVTTTNTTSSTSTKLFADDSKKTSIWIRGMTPSTKASSVKQLASQYGKVVQSKIFNSRPIDGEVKNCFALVTFADVPAMELAIASLHRKNYQGRVLRVEKVSESHLTGSAERIAQEKREAEEKKKIDEQQPTKPSEPPKKRAVIMAPEDTPPKKPTSSSAPTKQRPTIQAPPSSNNNNNNKSKRPQIQPPERSRSRERSRDAAAAAATSSKRKPITYDDRNLEAEDEGWGRGDANRSISIERDSRRSIAPPPPVGTRRGNVSPLRSSSRSSGRSGGGHQESLIISARVDTSGCRGGGVTIQRSVERSIPNNISTSQLRRHQAQAPPPTRHAPIPPAPRASYQTEQYTRETYRQERSPPPPSRRRYAVSPDRRDSDPPARRGGRGGVQKNPEQEPLRRRQYDEDERAQRERAMVELMARKEEEMRVKEERRELEREKEKVRFEKEKLEREKLKIELEKQKLALEQYAAAGIRLPASGGSSGASDDRRGRHDSGGGRRRPASDAMPPPAIPTKMSTTHDRRGGSSSSSSSRRDQGARHTSSSSHNSSSRNATYGIQSRGSNHSTNHHDDYSKMFEHPRGAANTHPYGRGGATAASTNDYDAQSTIGGYQNFGYQTTNAYPVWEGLDGQGHLPSDVNWTQHAAPSSSSTSSMNGGGGHQWHQPQSNYSSTSSSSNRREYGYRNNY